MSELRITPRGSAFRIEVRVQPRASRSEIVGVQEGVLRVRLTAPPVEGEANAALIRLLAAELDISRSAVRIVKGVGSRNKVVEVEGSSVGVGERLAR